MELKKTTKLAFIGVLFMALMVGMLYLFCNGELDFLDPDITICVILGSGIVGFGCGLFGLIGWIRSSCSCISDEKKYSTVDSINAKYTESI